jgi:very-short-patch-repair endonuclease
MSAAQAKRRHPSKKLRISTSLALPGVVYESGWSAPLSRERNIRRFARANRRSPTAAERRLNDILKGLGYNFKTQYQIAGKWLLDFYLPRSRVGIEVDGSFHNDPTQISRDMLKSQDCHRARIILLRFKNEEVLGDRAKLIANLRSRISTSLRLNRDFGRSVRRRIEARNFLRWRRVRDRISSDDDVPAPLLITRRCTIADFIQFRTGLSFSCCNGHSRQIDLHKLAERLGPDHDLVAAVYPPATEWLPVKCAVCAGKPVMYFVTRPPPASA